MIYHTSMAEIFQELKDSSCPTNINLSTIEDQVRLHLAAVNTGCNTDTEMVPLAAQARQGGLPNQTEHHPNAPAYQQP